MVTTSLRLGLLLATFVASLHVAAEPRVWTLTDVQIQRFSPSAVSDPTDPVTGWFVYDDATRTISNWSVRFPVPFFDFPSFSYVPGNSLTYVADFGFQAPFLGFLAVMASQDRISGSGNCNSYRSGRWTAATPWSRSTPPNRESTTFSLDRRPAARWPRAR
jgi:hypothetical protein